jgi:hypothetical protein
LIEKKDNQSCTKNQTGESSLIGAVVMARPIRIVAGRGNGTGHSTPVT